MSEPECTVSLGTADEDLPDDCLLMTMDLAAVLDEQPVPTTDRWIVILSHPFKLPLTLPQSIEELEQELNLTPEEAVAVYRDLQQWVDNYLRAVE